MSIETRIIILAIAMLANNIVTALTYLELQRMKRSERVFDEDTEDYGESIE